MADLIERIAMYNSWIDKGPPPVYWISGFYFTHAFLTGVRQNYARKHALPIDTITFNYRCMPAAEYTQVGREKGDRSQARAKRPLTMFARG